MGAETVIGDSPHNHQIGRRFAFDRIAQNPRRVHRKTREKMLLPDLGDPLRCSPQVLVREI